MGYARVKSLLDKNNSESYVPLKYSEMIRTGYC